MPNDSLWRNIESFVLDEPQAALPFSQRLARDNGWSHEFALRAVSEYLRFMYLTCTAKHPVTPSNEVDAVWHLHLTYTKSYWENLCGQVLGRKVHHSPTRGGEKEGLKYKKQYEKTLQSYASAFGSPPPADIWPDAAIRFDPETQPRSVTSRDYIILPRKRYFFLGWITIPRMLLVIFLTSLLGAATASENSLTFLGFSEKQLLATTALTAVAAFIYAAVRGTGGDGSGAGCSDGCGGGCGGD